MHHFTACLTLVILFSCRSNPGEKPNPSNHQEIECVQGEDTINFVTTFTKDTTSISTDHFYAITRFIASKGVFRPELDKTGKLRVQKETKKIFPVVYDSCEGKRWVKKNFVMRNIQVSKLDFRGEMKDKRTGFMPRLHFEEWKFASNPDRDSAMNIVQTVYTYPNNIVIYEKRYSQFILSHKRIFLLETGAKFAEPYAIEYKKLIEQFIKH